MGSSERGARSREFATSIISALVAFAPVANAAFTFDDIRYWVGSGMNRAAIAIDWSDASKTPPALVWGYRWNGAATGRSMLAAVIAADPRLFAKLGGSLGSESAVYGLGYDANNDGQFAIDDGTTFDASGVAYTGPSDLAASIDPADYYAEGWFTGFWHYGVAGADPFDGSATWADSQLGMASRALTDGAWDSWTFSPTFNFGAFAQNPQAAAAPNSADFNGDGRVDENDYALWKSTFGSTTQLSADGNHDGIVDAADYTVWRDHLSPAGSGSGTTAAVPEPPSYLLALCFLCALLRVGNLIRKERV
jgi:hypothetical protein